MAQHGYVYLIQGPREAGKDLFKIGRTVNPKTRFSNLQTGSPVLLELVKITKTKNPKELERYLHEHCAEMRIHGEWFALGKRDVRSVKKIMQKHGGKSGKKRLVALLILSILAIGYFNINISILDLY
ncbi:MAG: GIY-YIG nuclease family protein [Chloroflexota bacterium]|nr:GIY-YIG nuclease family protein [Chloroflexota bacterium]